MREKNEKTKSYIPSLYFLSLANTINNLIFKKSFQKLAEALKYLRILKEESQFMGPWVSCVLYDCILDLWWVQVSGSGSHTEQLCDSHWRKPPVLLSVSILSTQPHGIEWGGVWKRKCEDKYGYLKVKKKMQCSEQDSLTQTDYKFSLLLISCLGKSPLVKKNK